MKSSQKVRDEDRSLIATERIDRAIREAARGAPPF